MTAPEWLAYILLTVSVAVLAFVAAEWRCTRRWHAFTADRRSHTRTNPPVPRAPGQSGR